MTDLSAALLPQLALAPVSREEIPPTQRALLDHERHMTHVHQAKHPAGLTLEVLQKSVAEDRYSREVLLRSAAGGSPLQWAILTVELRMLPAEVTAALRAARLPFGQILAESGLERRIDIEKFVRAALTDVFAARIGTSTTTAYGRQITIYCDDRPAVSVLELLLT